jgi:hypothetical protein
MAAETDGQSDAHVAVLTKLRPEMLEANCL